MRLWMTICALAWGIALGVSDPAAAADGADAAAVAAAVAHGDPVRTTAVAATVSPLSNGVVVSVGRALDLSGKPMFADRRAATGSISDVRFSDRPVIPARVSIARFRGASPLAGARVTSGYGYRYHPISGGWTRHTGVDLAIPAGTPVYASSAGSVARATWAGGYGLMVELDHGKGVQTRYAHLSRLAVHAGQSVAQGELVGYVGSTGRSTGAHLHYETRVNGAAVDPTRLP